MSDPMKFAGFEGFETNYINTLLDEAKQKPREINPADFQPKNVMPDTFRDMRGRQNKYFEDHLAYKENKLEQNERVELFYVLEQMNKKNESSGSNESEASKHLKEYFSKTENTFFYDKNKIN